MLPYRRLQLFVAAALTFVAIVGLGGTLTPRHEIFPFASWFLFSLVPDRRSEFDLLLRATADHPLDPPRSLRQADGLVGQPHSIVTYELIQQLGRAEQAHDERASRAVRRQIEGQFTGPVTRYELVRITYAPVERYRTDRVLETAPVRSYETGER